MSHLKVACVQLNVGPTWESHKDQALDLCRQAASDGATFITLPENTTGMPAQKPPIEAYPDQDHHPAVHDLAALAKETSTWVLCGSAAVRAGDMLANRSLLFSPEGVVAATYDKIHLFDATLPTGEVYHESARYSHGDKAVVVPLGDKAMLGMSICYDLRFGHLYRALAKNGATIISAPSAYTVPTGLLHWEVLLRARAIETGAFMIAAAQCGTHDGGRQTYGHSMIVDPWGRIIKQMGTEVGFITADLDLSEVDKVRSTLPALQHDRAFSLVVQNGG